MLLCLAIESVVLLLVVPLMTLRGWPWLCAGPCSEAEAWGAYMAAAAIASGAPLVYGVVSLVLGRTPLMVAMRVPGLWRTLRKPAP